MNIFIHINIIKYELYITMHDIIRYDIIYIYIYI